LEIAALREAAREAMDSVTSRLPRAADASEQTTILLDLVRVLERDEPKLTTLNSLFERDIDAEDATLTMILDRADSLTSEPGFRQMLERVASLAPMAEEHAAVTGRLSTGLESVGENEVLHHAIDRYSSNLRRFGRACSQLQVLGHRAQAILNG
jgi:hypothetical protein